MHHPLTDIQAEFEINRPLDIKVPRKKLLTQMDRQTDRQTDRQIDRQTDGQTGGQTSRTTTIDKLFFSKKEKTNNNT